MSIGLNVGEEYLRMTELKKIEIRIEKEQRKLKHLKKNEKIHKMNIRQK